MTLYHVVILYYVIYYVIVTLYPVYTNLVDTLTQGPDSQNSFMASRVLNSGIRVRGFVFSYVKRVIRLRIERLRVGSSKQGPRTYIDTKTGTLRGRT